VVFAATVGVSNVLAAEGSQHIAATPSSAELTIAPGKSASENLEIINQGTDSFRVKAYVAPYHVQGIDYDPQFTQLPGTVNASKWVTLTTPEATTLAPGKLLHIAYQVQVPAGTAPGGYYAVIFAETTPTKNANGVVAHNRVGEILYLTVAGKVETKGKVEGPNLDRFNMSGTLSVPTLVSNTGGVHFQSKVTVTVKNVFGKTIFTQSEQRYVLPQTQRQVVIQWDNLAPLGIYKISREATVPGGRQQLPARWVVMVQPWLLVAILIIAAALITAIVRRIQGRRKSH
jgi:hypothetical protein